MCPVSVVIVSEDDVDGSKRESMESPHRLSKQDISSPTRTAGPLFSTGNTLDSDEEDDLQALTINDQRAKASQPDISGQNAF